ncbi:hypothetical protein, partial [Actinotalea sp. JY-7885]
MRAPAGHGHRRPGRARLPRLGAAWDAQLRTSRSDVRPLALVAVALVLTLLLADAAPRLLTRVADETVRTAVAGAATAGLTVSARLPERAVETGRDPSTGEQLPDLAAQIADALPAELVAVLGPPVATVSTAELHAALPGGGEALMRMAYTWRDGEPGVEWVEGVAPGSSRGGDLSAGGPEAWPVEVGLAAPVAELLGARAGEPLTVAGPDRVPLDVTVTGIFRAQDPRDPVWSGVRGMLEPVVRGSGAGLTTTVGAYLSVTSVPDARVALLASPSGVSRSITFPPRAEAFDLAGLETVAQLAGGAEAAPQALAVPGPRPTVTTTLDTVLRAAAARVGAAGAQAAVVLVGVL